VHNNQRDGFHQHALHRGRANYEPNSLGGGCPFQAGAMKGFTSVAERLRDEMMKAEPSKLRISGEKFAEHFNQARLFWRSQSPAEQAHIVRAFRFELTRVQTQAVRERMVAQLRNVADDLAEQVAEGLGMALPEPLPRALAQAPDPEVDVSPGLSLLSRPGDGRILGRRVALLVADGVDAAALKALYEALMEAGAAPRYVGDRLGTVATADGGTLPVEVTVETAPSVLFDAVVLPSLGADSPPPDGLTVEFVQQQYRHCKPMLVPASAVQLLAAAGIADARAQDTGMLQVDDGALGGSAQAFIEAIARHRAWERQTDPPRV
jgi:catalase